MFAFVRLLFAAPVLVSATPAPQAPFHYPAVSQIICNEGKGSAFRIDDSRMLSVAHVTNATGCEINGQPIDAVQDAGLDFSVIARLGRGGFKINCEGFKAGQFYHAVGYAGGYAWQTTLTLLATYKTDEGMRVLLGMPTLIPGMSGGIVMNTKGEAVGMINAYRPWTALSYSLELRGTSVCGQGAGSNP